MLSFPDDAPLKVHEGCYLILSVDDDPINQLVVDNLLTPQGFKVKGVRSETWVRTCSQGSEVRNGSFWCAEGVIMQTLMDLEDEWLSFVYPV